MTELQGREDEDRYWLTSPGALFTDTSQSQSLEQYLCASINSSETMFSREDDERLFVLSLTSSILASSLRRIHVFIDVDQSIHWLSSKGPNFFSMSSLQSEVCMYLSLNPTNYAPPYRVEFRSSSEHRKEFERELRIEVKLVKGQVFYPLFSLNSSHHYQSRFAKALHEIRPSDLKRALVFQISRKPPTHSEGLVSLPEELLDSIIRFIYRSNPMDLFRLRKVSRTWKRLCSIYQSEPQSNLEKEKLLRTSPLSGSLSKWELIKYDRRDFGIDIERIISLQPETTRLQIDFLPLEALKRSKFLDALATLEKVKEVYIYDIFRVWEEEEVVDYLENTKSRIQKIALSSLNFLSNSSSSTSCVFHPTHLPVRELHLQACFPISPRLRALLLSPSVLREMVNLRISISSQIDYASVIWAEEPVDLSNCAFLKYLGLDGGQDTTRLVMPNFLDTFHVPQTPVSTIRKIELYYIRLSSLSVRRFLEKAGSRVTISIVLFFGEWDLWELKDTGEVLRKNNLNASSVKEGGADRASWSPLSPPEHLSGLKI
ncbi:hypothetical protein BT69DRAFT_1318430 [Atractiella rhizophila]|nr:hypothetical protein BT69DRAFT_1318430 [Atractiella rhizophila]